MDDRGAARHPSIGLGMETLIIYARRVLPMEYETHLVRTGLDLRERGVGIPGCARRTISRWACVNVAKVLRVTCCFLCDID